MHDVSAMHGVHRSRQRFHKLGRLASRHRLAAEFAGEVASLDELQHAVGMTVRLADLVNLDDIGMLQPCHGLRFGPEARQLTWSGMSAIENHFEGDHAQLGVRWARLVDDPHAAAAEDTFDHVARHRNRGRSRLGLPPPPSWPTRPGTKAAVSSAAEDTPCPKVRVSFGPGVAAPGRSLGKTARADLEAMLTSAGTAISSPHFGHWIASPISSSSTLISVEQEEQAAWMVMAQYPGRHVECRRKI